PGAAAARTATRARPTTAPAAAIASSSPAVRKGTTFLFFRPKTTGSALPVSSVAEGGQRPGVDLFDLADTVDGDDEARVVVEQRLGLLAVDPQPVADDLFGVVVATTREHPLDHGVLGDDEAQHRVQLLVDAGQDLLQRLGLVDRARVTVEDEAVGGVRLADARLDHAVGHIARHQVAGVHVLLRLEAQRGLLADVGTEEVPGGDVRDAQLFRQEDGLGAFAGTGRTEQYNSHLRNPS